MTRGEAIEVIKDIYNYTRWDTHTTNEARTMAIKALEQEPTTKNDLGVDVPDIIIGNIDCISRADAIHAVSEALKHTFVEYENIANKVIGKLTSVTPQEPKTGHCKDCKYFEYDSVAKVDGIPLIVGHEICHKWGDGCKTSENGYCFLYEGKGKE